MSENPIPAQKFSKAIPVALLVLAAGLFFREALTFAGYFFHFDLISINVPFRDFFFRAVAQGSFPRWAPGMCCGFPIFAEGETGPFYLLNYPFFPFLPVHVALNMTVILHAILALLGMYAYLARNHTRAAAATGALGYAFSSYLMFHVVHLMSFQSACLIPWLFFFFDRYLTDGRRTDILFSALFLTLILTVGHQQGPVFSVVGFSLFCLFLGAEAWMSERGKPAARMIGAGIFIAIIAAASVSVIIAAMAELLRHTARKDAMDAALLYTHSLRPDMLPRLASPFHHGRSMFDTWLLNRNEKDLAVYLGLAVWVFAPLAFAGKSDRRDRAHLGVVLTGFLLILGNGGPFDGVLEHIPVLNRMRIPTRYMLPMTVSLAYLAASGIDRLRRGEWTPRRAAAWCGAGAAVWAATAWGGALLTYGKIFISAGISIPAGIERSLAAISQLKADLIFRSTLAASLVLCGTLLAWAENRKNRASALIAFAIGAIVFWDVASVGRNENPVVDEAFYHPKETVSFLHANLDGRRIYSTDNYEPFGRPGWGAGTDSYLDGIAGMPQFTPMMFGIKTAVCGLPLDFARNKKVYGAMTQAWLRQMSVKYVLSRNALPWPTVLQNGAVRIYEIPDPPAIYGFAKKVVPVDGEEDAYSSVVRAGDEDVRTAFVEGFAGPVPEETSDPSTQNLRVLAEEPEKRVLKTEASRSSFLIVRETYYPGWHAAVDGNPTPIHRVNYLFYGIAVPAGAHEIVLSYRPGWFWPLALLNLVLVLGLVTAVVFSKSLRQSREPFLGVPENASAAGKMLLTGIAVFLILLVIGIARHPHLWGF